MASIDVAALLSVAEPFTVLRAEIVQIISDNVGCEDFRLTGQEVAAEALIFFFAEKLATQGEAP